MVFSKSIFRGIALGVCAILMLTGCENKPKAEVSAVASDKVTWELAMSWNASFPPFSSPPLELAKLVSEMSGGDFQIKVDAVNKHKAAFGVLDMVRLGQYEIGHSAPLYWRKQDSATPLFASMPFSLNALEQYSWFYFGGGLQLMQKVFTKHGVYSFPGGNTGVQMGGWFKKEINSLEDFKGLKMRIPGFAGQIFAKLGCTVSNIAPGELFAALERGDIDALEWVGPGMDIGMGFHKIAPYYYTGWHEPATELHFIVNKAKFDGLSPKNKEILRVAMKVSAYNMLIENTNMNSLAWDKMKTEYPDIQVKTFPKPVMDEMKKVNNELIREELVKNAEFKEVYDSQQAYLKKARAWTNMGEFAYIRDNQ